MHKFTIMIDTNSDLPQEYIDENDLKIIPMPFDLDGKQYEGRWQGISDKDFYNSLRNGGVAGTALINPETYVSRFTEYAERGESLLAIVLSGGLSGTYQNSVIALNDVKEHYPDCDIHTVDSLSAASGCSLIVRWAVKKRGEGLTAAETAQWLRENAGRCISLFTVDDLMYLHRGGRVSKLSAMAGSLIGIKPLLNVAPDGTLKLKDKVRGRKAALETLVKQMTRSLPPNAELDTVLISHTDCEEDAQTVAAMVRAAVNVKELVIMMMSPIIGAHVGPGCIALFFKGTMTREEYEAKFYNANNQ